MSYKDFLYHLILPFKDYFQSKKISDYYKNNENNPEIVECLNYIQKTGKVRSLNYPFVEKYSSINIPVYFDKEKKMYYVNHNSRKMYYSRSFSSQNDVRESYRLILEEQDIESPHCYLSEEFDIEYGSVVIDAGVAEGNFSVDNIDRCSKIILVEYDSGWVNALRSTFHKEIEEGKVIIIDKKLGEKTDSNTITLDEIYSKFGKIDFVKMDIEGSEQLAIKGAYHLINESDHLKMAVCAYHSPKSYDQIKEMLEGYFSIEVTKGYMVLNPVIGWIPPYFRRGMIRAERKSFRK